MSIKITAANYHTYKQVYEIISHHLYSDLSKILAIESSPISILNNWEAQSKSLARRGLQAGLNDSLSSISHYPPGIFKAINTDLVLNKLPDLFTLAGSIQKTISKVLKTKKIQNIDQYYIVKEMLDDTSSPITETDKNILSTCMYNFEQATHQ